MARKYHPDKNKAPGATEAFKKIGSAFNVLTDSTKRRRYDQFGTVDEERPPVMRRRENVYTFDANGGFDGNVSFFSLYFMPLLLAEFINMFFNGGFPFSQNVRYARHHAQHHESNDVSFADSLLILIFCLNLLLGLYARFSFLFIPVRSNTQ